MIFGLDFGNPVLHLFFVRDVDLSGHILNRRCLGGEICLDLAQGIAVDVGDADCAPAVGDEFCCCAAYATCCACDGIDLTLEGHCCTAVYSEDVVAVVSDGGVSVISSCGGLAPTVIGGA